MFSTIVVGTDGSADAERALRATADLAARGDGTEVHVVTASHPLPAAELRAIAHELPAEYRPLLHGHVMTDSVMDGARNILEIAGIEAIYHVIDDDPGDALIDLAEAVDADLVVVGSRGAGAADRLLHGSVSTKVIHRAPCAVLVMRDDADRTGAG